MENRKKLLIGLVLILAVLAGGLFIYAKYRTKPVPPPLEKLTAFEIITKLQGLEQKKDYSGCITQAAKIVGNQPDATEAWQWKGICEFESGKFSEAKADFEKVLTIDSSNKSAKSYLDILNSGAELFHNTDLNQKQFEEKLPVELDLSSLKFVSAYSRQASSKEPQKLLFFGRYDSAKTLSQTKDFLKSQLGNGAEEQETSKDNTASLSASENGQTINIGLSSQDSHSPTIVLIQFLL